MNRQNLFSDEWDGEGIETGTRQRVFWRPEGARLGATLYELGPGAPEPRIHMHFGAEEMFFVVERASVPPDASRYGGARPGRVRLLPRGPRGTAHVQQSG